MPLSLIAQRPFSCVVQILPALCLFSHLHSRTRTHCVHRFILFANSRQSFRAIATRSFAVFDCTIAACNIVRMLVWP
jgi:hypothetical protein